MSFTGQLWQQIKPTYAAILSHPFIAELTTGTLSRERFAFYMKQDALYLQDFSRALAITAARSPHVPDLQAYLEFAHGAAVVERILHESYFSEFGVTLDIDQSPSCLAYTQFLLATSSLSSVSSPLLCEYAPNARDASSTPPASAPTLDAHTSSN